MKKFLMFFAVLLAVATVFAGNLQQQKSYSNNELHWFNEFGYQGTATEASQREICDGALPEECMRGYEEIDGQGNGVGTPVILYKE